MGDPAQSGGYTFRLATSSDADAISRVVSASWDGTYGNTVTPEERKKYLEDVASPTALSRELELAKYRFILAYPSNRESESGGGEGPAGMAQLNLDSSESCITLPHSIELQRFYVVPSYQGKGLARALMQAAQDQAQKEGAESMWLGVWEDAPRARAFYRKHGYEECGEHFFPYLTTVHRDIVMQKKL